MNLILEYDDFCSQDPENCLDTIYEMIKEAPHIKFNLFTVIAMRGKNNSFKWISEVSKLVKSNNVRLCFHGLFHNHLEFENISKPLCESYIESMMAHVAGDWISGCWLPVFRGPNWGLNPITIETLISSHFTHIYNHENHKYLEDLYSDKIKFIYYNQNLKDNFNTNMTDTMIAHGHTHNVCDNGIRETKDKVLKFIDQYNPTFLWANEI